VKLAQVVPEASPVSESFGAELGGEGRGCAGNFPKVLFQIVGAAGRIGGMGERAHG
jgi:hypothetical protein